MKLRKIIAALCCGAMLVANTTIIGFAATDTYDNFSIGTGDESQLVKEGGLDDYGCAHITLQKSGDLLSDIKYAKFELLVTKGAFVNEVNGSNNGISDKVGMYTGSGRNKKYIVSSNGQLAVKAYNDTYDAIAMNFASSNGLGQDDSTIADLYFTYADSYANTDIELVLDKVTVSYDGTTNTVFNGDQKYTLKANSSVVEKVEAATGKTVTIADTTNGTVTASATTDVAEGTEVTLTVTPDEGYELDTISAATATGTVEIVDNKFTMPAEDVTVTATFKKIKVVADIADTDVKDGVDGFSKGFAAEFKNIPEAAKTTVKWTLTKNGVSQDNSYDYDTTGVSGNVKFGLVITVDAADKFDGVSAAAELE